MSQTISTLLLAPQVPGDNYHRRRTDTDDGNSIVSVHGEPVEPPFENKGEKEQMWREKEKLALTWLEETLPTLKEPLTSDAWLWLGVK